LADIPSIALLGEIARGHRVDVVSNILASLDDLKFLPRNGNLKIATSFHPHKWRDVEEFIAKRKQIESSGIDCGNTIIVGYPPNLNDILGWISTLKEQGVETVEIAPFHGGFDGKLYPQDYEEEEWKIVRGSLEEVYDEEELLFRSPKGKSCWAGCKYIYIRWDGDIYSCYMSNATRLGNLLERDVRPWSKPHPCPEDSCPCPDMWKYVEGEDI
jgi:MoaA/NifB/PqqE/SkfB family radical SAM enzyme